MKEDTGTKQKVLIVDDSEMNRDILSAILGDEYEIIEAEDGTQAIAVLQKHSAEISVLLLDIVMPEMDGYEVLALMNSNRWIEEIPVIIISAENSPSFIERAYELGVTDFISRPFDATIVRRRVVNTILLNTKQRRLEQLVAEQIYEKESNSQLMITILSHIVEFRNGESGLHILHVQTFTDMLLRRLVQMTGRYNLSNADIALISKASALHDIGKIAIPDEILNKPGRLTNEEFAIMKTHSMAGASMLEALPVSKDEPLVKVAYEICRWHHERYDGRGYPDGLKGDEIPISAQIVSLADVYDALTSERIYKKAYSHEKAVEMILNGECGAFNPLALECLKIMSSELKDELQEKSYSRKSADRFQNVADEMLKHSELVSSERTLQMLEYERVKNNFFSSVLQKIEFEYTVMPPMLTLSTYGAERLGLKTVTMNPHCDERVCSVLDSEAFERFLEAVRNTTPEQPFLEHDCKINYMDGARDTRIISRSIWSNDTPPQYTGAIGIFKPLEKIGEKGK